MQPRFAGFADKKELLKRHGHDLANLRAGVGFALVKRSQCKRKVRLRELALVAAWRLPCRITISTGALGLLREWLVGA